MTIASLPAAAVMAAGAAACSLNPAQADLLRPADCFGDVPYMFTGWTTLAEIDQHDGPADGRVFARITRDEIVITVSPPAADGSTFSLVGQGVCWTWPGAAQISRAAFGETRREPGR